MHQYDILIFKTNICSVKDLKKVKSLLDRHPGVTRWHVDQGDVDKVLRIESSTLTTHQVIDLIGTAGYACEELAD